MPASGPPSACLSPIPTLRAILYPLPVPTQRDQAVVLRRWDFSETSQTVSLFGRERGLLRGIAKGAKRPRSRFSGGFEPLTRGEAVAIVKPTAELANIIEWDLQEVFPGPRRSLDAFHAGMFLVDLVDHAVTHADPHPELWDELVRALRSLGEPEAEMGRTLARFQWATLVETGHRPDLRSAPAESGDPGTLGFDPAAGRLVPDPGGDALQRGVWRIRRETVDLLVALDAWWSGGPAPAPADDPKIRRANRFLSTLLRWVIGSELPTSQLLFSDPPHPGPARRQGDA